ncbi:MAG: response regulator [Kiritimatiellia bacterium]
MQLLLVDDDPIVLKVLSTLFKHAGCEYATASSAKQALDICEQRLFGLVISDLNMPDMDGVELARQMRVQHPDIPLFAFTGSSGDNLMAEAKGVFDRVFVKPDDYSRLVSESTRILKEKEAVAV